MRVFCRVFIRHSTVVALVSGGERYETLCREVADSITWRRFCRIPLDGRVPQPTTRCVRFHDLRHTFATFLLAEGTPARVVMELLGHSQIGITMNTYAHVLPALSSASVEALASQLAGLRDEERGDYQAATGRP